MNLLLDTYVSLWAITDSPRLSLDAKRLITAERTNVLVSVASHWEITINYSLVKGDMPISGKNALGYFQVSGYRILSISPEHAITVSDLPSHHRDPFDRMIVSQALVEPLRLMTHDSFVQLYSPTIIYV